MQLGFLSCFPANMPASVRATVGRISGEHRTTYPSSCGSGLLPASVRSSTPLLTPSSPTLPASKRASFCGTVSIEAAPKRTWNDIGEILEPGKITLNLKLKTEQLSDTLNRIAKDAGRVIADAMDKAILGIMNMSKAMKPLSIPIQWVSTVDSKPCVASGQVAYAPVVHETFSNLRADEIVERLTRRVRRNLAD